MPRWIATPILAACAALALAGPTRAADTAALVAAEQTLAKAVSAYTPADLLKARAGFVALLANEPDSPTLRYWIAVCDWRVVPILMQKDKEKAERLCSDGIEQCEKGLAANPKFAELIALKAGLLGLSISFNPDQAMTIGPQLEGFYANATKLEPKNPRIRLLEGMNTMHKPDFIGGGPVFALDALKKAAELFEAETPANAAAPDWGKTDAYLWAGRAALQIKKYEEARDYFKKVLAADPDHQWVKHTLLPEAEKALAAKEKS